MTIVHWRHLLRQSSSGMHLPGVACAPIIALELRMEGYRGLKPSECLPAVREIARVQCEAIGFHDWLENIAAPGIGRSSY